MPMLRMHIIKRTRRPIQLKQKKYQVNLKFLFYLLPEVVMLLA